MIELMTKDNKIQILIERLNFPEGPAVDSVGNIWFVEQQGGDLVRFSVENKITRYPTNGSPNGIAIDTYDHVWFCDSQNNCISVFEPKRESTRIVCDNVNGTPLDKPNDLAFDDSGNLIFTCPGNSRYEPTGYVCALVKGKAKKIAEHKYFPNGLAFTAAGKELIIAETYKHRLWKGKWNSTSATWLDVAPWVEVGGPIGPDGMAFDENNNLYVAVFGQQRIKVISPQGIIIEEILLPGRNPTNCAFLRNGGLIVTEAERGELLWVDNKIKGISLCR